MSEITYFDFDTTQLSGKDQKVVESLTKAGEAMHAIWDKQKADDGGNVKVYPSDATSEELLKAAESDPSILDGYTVVERDGDGFKTIPYHEAYKEELELYYKYLEEAAKNTDEAPLKEYISKVIEAYKVGDYEAAMAAFLMNPHTRIEFLGGPIETFEDHLLGRKHMYQFNVRVLKEDATDEVTDMVDVMKNIKLPQPETSLGSSLEKSNIDIRLDDLLFFAGRQAGHLISSTNLPNEPRLVEQYGTKVIVYTTSMNEKFDDRHVPLLPYFEGLDLDKRVDEMKVAMFRWIALHEIAEATVKFKGMDNRLASNLTYMRELNAHLVGLDSAKYQLLNGVISLQEYKDMISALFVFGIDVWNIYENSGALKHYAEGFAVAFNFFVRNGSLSFENGMIIIDFAKVSRDIETLSNITMSICEEGDEEDARKLFEEYGDFELASLLPKVEVE